MSNVKESKTVAHQTSGVGPEVEISRGDMLGVGFRITVDKSTHRLTVPGNQETEATLTIEVVPTVGVGCTAK